MRMNRAGKACGQSIPVNSGILGRSDLKAAVLLDTDGRPIRDPQSGPLVF